MATLQENTISLRVCIVEGDPQDAAIVQSALGTGDLTEFETVWISDAQAGIEAMVSNTHDAYLLGTSIGDRDGIEVLKAARSGGCRRPIVLLTEIKLRELDAEAIAAGATDFLNKDDISAPLLERTLRLAVEGQRARIALLEAESRAPRHVLTDGLTGLPNRTLFIERLEQALRRSRRTADYRFAVLYLDIDGFSQLNERFGHSVGDLVLTTVGRRLARQLREVDTVARLGGDEFCILLDGTADEKGVEVVSRRLSAIVNEPIACGDARLSVGCSIGVVFSPRSYQRPMQLLSDADSAMAAARQARAALP